MACFANEADASRAGLDGGSDGRGDDCADICRAERHMSCGPAGGAYAFPGLLDPRVQAYEVPRTCSNQMLDQKSSPAGSGKDPKGIILIL
jgi:hypothetical protein